MKRKKIVKVLWIIISFIVVVSMVMVFSGGFMS